MSQMAMTDRERSFLDAVLAGPGDDAVRLIMADWLDDHGQPERAEFIRVQIELARLDVLEACDRQDEPDGCDLFTVQGKCFPCQRKLPFRRRERELWRGTGRPIHHPCQWFDVPDWACYADVGLAKIVWTLPGDVEVTCDISRGFVASVSLTLDDFMKHAKAIFGAAPVEEVRLLDREPYPNAAGCYLWDSGRHEYSWVRPTSVIPVPLYSLIEGVCWHENRASWKVFRTSEAAHAALSHACIAYGRDLALPAKEAVSR